MFIIYHLWIKKPGLKKNCCTRWVSFVQYREGVINVNENVDDPYWFLLSSKGQFHFHVWIKTLHPTMYVQGGGGDMCFTNIFCYIWYHEADLIGEMAIVAQVCDVAPEPFLKIYFYSSSNYIDFSNRIKIMGRIWWRWSDIMVYCRIIELEGAALFMESKYIFKICWGVILRIYIYSNS